MARTVLDASALLALLNEEPGADDVIDVLPDAVVSAVNLAEVASKLADAGMPADAVRDALGGLGVEVAPFDSADALDTGLLRPRTRTGGLSLGDRACLALAGRLGAPAMTTDRVWKRLRVGVKVCLIGR